MNWFTIRKNPSTINLSEYLSKKLNHDYTYPSQPFFGSTRVTIEKFFIIHKIERVKGLLVYNELTLTEIAYKCIIAVCRILSSQFKRVTGLNSIYFLSNLEEKAFDA